MSFKKREITTQELLDWKRNNLYNPRTNRKIKKNGRLFKYIQERYNNVFPLGFDIFDSNDERDPISLKYFYNYDLSNNKQLVYTDISNLILYKEDNDIQHTCFILYDLINTATSEGENETIGNKIYESFPWSIKQNFKSFTTLPYVLKVQLLLTLYE